MNIPIEQSLSKKSLVISRVYLENYNNFLISKDYIDLVIAIKAQMMNTVLIYSKIN